MSVLARQRLELVRSRQPDTVALAARLCLAARAEPALVRAARLSTQLDAMVESDLWFSGLVAGAGPLGLALDPAIADLLRAELDDEERERAWALLEAHHGAEPWSIRLEERINYLTAGGRDAEEVDELLAAALDELHDTDEVGIARWLFSALGRLPATARARPAAAAAGVAAGVRLDGRIGDLGALSDEQRATWLPKLLGGLGTTELPVRLVPGAIVLGGDPAGAVLVRVPQTDPIAVTVEWDGGAADVRLRAGDEHRVDAPWARQEVSGGRSGTLIVGAGTGGQYDVGAGAHGAMTLDGGESDSVAAGGWARVRTITGDATELTPIAVGRLERDNRQSAPACAVAESVVVTTADLAVERMRFAPISGPTVACEEGSPRIDGELAYLNLAAPVVAPPLIVPRVGDRWRFADGRPGGGTVALLNPSEILIATEGSFEIERGATVITERPWGAAFGVMLGRTMQGFVRVAPLADAAAEPRYRIAYATDVALDEIGLGAQHPFLGDAYVRRDVDAQLDRTLVASDVVSVGGREHSGKARALWQALRRVDALVAIPLGGDVTFTDAPTNAVLWLDHVAFDPATLPQGLKVAAVLAADAPGATHIPSTLSRTEEQWAWEDFGPEIALDPNDPWSADELAARERAVARARREGDPQRLAIALGGYGWEVWRVGRTGDALTAFEEALQLWRRLPELPAQLADGLKNVASVCMTTGDQSRAVSLLEEAVTLRRGVGPPAELVETLTHLADALGRANRRMDAVAAAQEAVAQARETGPETRAIALRTLSNALQNVGDQRAIETAQEAAELLREAQLPQYSNALDQVAHALGGFERFGEAVEVTRTALAVATPGERVGLNVRFAQRLDAAGDHDQALAVLDETLPLVRERGQELLLVPALELAAELAERAGRIADATVLNEELLASTSQDADRRAETEARLARLTASRSIRTWGDGTIRLTADRLELPDRAIARDTIASVQITHGSFRRLPKARVELRNGEAIEFEIRAASTLNFPANNRAAEDFLEAMTVRQEFT